MHVKPASHADWTQELVERHPPVGTLTLHLDRQVIQVAANHQAILDGLAEYYRCFLGPAVPIPDIDCVVIEGAAPDVGVPFEARPPEPGKQGIKDETYDFTDGRLLRKRRTGMLFLFGGTLQVAIGPALANLNQVINFINNRFAQWHMARGALLAHAAGVARGGHGLAISGMSNRGKSTLTLQLLERDLDFVTNDRLLLCKRDDAPRMLGLPKYPRVNPGTLLANPRLADLVSPSLRARLADLPADELWTVEHKHDVDVETHYGPGRFQPMARLAALVILNWRLDAGPMRARRVDLRERRDLLPAFMKRPGAHYFAAPGEPDADWSDDDYLARLGDCPVMELAGGVDFEHAADACLTLLSDAGAGADR